MLLHSSKCSFYGVNAEGPWLFPLVGCLLVSSLFGWGELSQGNKGVQRWCEQTWHLGIGWELLLISEKSYK